MAKTIGLIGGMSPQSSAEYYRIINEASKARLGGRHNVRTLMLTLDFGEIESMQHRGEWAALEAGGADCVVLCTNTMHKVAAAIESAVAIPLLHIADATGAAIRAAAHTRVGLLGTRFTMEQDFYRQRLEQRHSLEVLVPDGEARNTVHRIIYDELCQGRVLDESRLGYRRIIAELGARGAQAVILGCTEIVMLIGPRDSSLPVFDTTSLHACAAVEWALHNA